MTLITLGTCQGLTDPLLHSSVPGADPPEMTCGFLIQLVFCEKKKTMWFIGV